MCQSQYRQETREIALKPSGLRYPEAIQGEVIGGYFVVSRTSRGAHGSAGRLLSA